MSSSTARDGAQVGGSTLTKKVKGAIAKAFDVHRKDPNAPTGWTCCKCRHANWYEDMESGNSEKCQGCNHENCAYPGPPGPGQEEGCTNLFGKKSEAK